MIDVHQQIYDKVEDIFSVEQIRRDLYAYFKNKGSEIIEITSYNQTGDSKTTEFYLEDGLTLIEIRIVKRYKDLIYIPFVVEIVVGLYEVDKETGIENISKFKAELSYSKDFEILIIDYSH